MKKLLVVALIVAGCGGGSPMDAAATVRAKYPDARVVTAVGRAKYCFVVCLRDGSVRFVECLNMSDDQISSDTLIAEPAK